MTKEEIEKKKKLQRLKKAEEESGKAQVQAVSATYRNRDANIEKQQVKRYKNAPISDSDLDIKDGVLGKGTFSILTKKKKRK